MTTPRAFLPLTIVADDLTGACDTGALFAGSGAVPVTVWPAPAPSARVRAIDTESRSLEAGEAARRVRTTTGRLKGTMFKKIDSTLRGRVGPEIDALMRAGSQSSALVCPALPAERRVVLDRVLTVGSVPVAETPMAADPDFPAATGSSSVIDLLRPQLDRPLAWKLWGIFALGAAQGVMGWLMVKSGLVDDPKVNPVRLTAHLALALAIFAAELWIALGLLAPGAGRARRLAAALPFVVFAMALSGGMVAGLRAGAAYQTFPLMNGHFVPPEILLLEPWWMNFVHNMATVQFVHRGFFWLLLVLVPLAWWRRRDQPSAHVLLGLFAAQATLGVATLLAGVPTLLAAAHQSGAALLLGAALWHAHREGCKAS